ncbi:hypothetical protein [Winogradskyella poriferorum]|uniref:Uncharacterized protein n=1 Tax=Winogradskyella poriferorum TaxID=307627 RepID=A0ABU7W5R0_9FLAO
MKKDEIEAKIVYKQELINQEGDQNKKNKLIQDLSILKMRLDMEKTQMKINQFTNRDY